MEKNKTKKIIVIIALLAVVILLIVLMQKNGILNKKQSQRLANVGYTTQIGNKQYNITNQIENDITPTISAGMIPIKQDGEYWTIVDRTANDWCSYANGIPAYMMLNDGKYQSEEYYQMPDTEQIARAGTQIDKNSADLGSIYMWVPRYAYNENGDIIYIKQESVVAGSWTMPDVFTYKTEKEDYALAGIWVECSSLGETELTNKISGMNTKDSHYGFISNTKTAVMTEDEQDATQILVENLNALVGASITRPQIDDISNANHSVIHIISTNILEPIQINAYLENDEGKIVIEIKYSKNSPIQEIINGDGIELTKDGDKYIQSLNDMVSPYIAIDNSGNLKEVKFDNIFVIRNVEDMCNFRNMVNAGKDFEGYTVLQVADLDMSEVCGEDIGSWEPIGNGTVAFAGTYDGMYYTISNLYIKSDKYIDLAMFRGSKSTTVIKNIVLENIYIYNECSDPSVGAKAAGIVTDNVGIIEQCGINSGKISAIKNNTTINYTGANAGGIANGNAGGTILRCYNKATIYAKTVTYNSSELAVGGIARSSGGGDLSQIIDCYNIGDLTYDGGTAQYIGGITADNYNGNAIIKNCYNIGNLATNGSNKIMGGIHGRNSYGKSLSITNSYCLSNSTNGATQVDSDTMKTYAETLGESYKEDIYGLNNGYPILEWELSVKDIIGNVYVDTDEGKIIVEISNHKYPISRVAKLIDGAEIPLFSTSDTIYTDTLSDGTHTYVVTDVKGNKIQLEIGPIKILNSASDLCEFRDAVNNGNNFAGAIICQTADIDMSSVCGEDIGSWEPIGKQDNVFAGTYDGNFYTISNLYIHTDTECNLLGSNASVGLFSSTTESTVIKNIVMTNVDIYNAYEDSQITNITGAIVGMNNGLIQNCGVESGNIITVKDNTYSSYFNSYTGGIAGRLLLGGIINQCYNKAYVSTERHTSSSGLQALAGGITGYMVGNTKITNCYNTGNLNVSGVSTIVGGIVGEKGSTGDAAIQNCYNIGAVSSAGYSGGVIGRIWSGNVSVTNTYCLTYTGYGRQVSSDTLKGYATTLGFAYANDDGRNNGYPILKWELERK